MTTSNVVLFSDLCQGMSNVDAHDVTLAIIEIKSNVAAMAKGLTDLEKRQTEAETVRNTLMTVIATQSAQQKDIALYKWIFGAMTTVLLAVNGWQAKVLYDLVTMHLKP